MGAQQTTPLYGDDAGEGLIVMGGDHLNGLDAGEWLVGVSGDSPVW